MRTQTGGIKLLKETVNGEDLDQGGNRGQGRFKTTEKTAGRQ